MLHSNKLEERIGYVFKDKSLLENALRHSSYINEHGLNKTDCNERVEFLGDSVLELVSSEFLYTHLPETPEGEMTKLRASLVCESALFNDAKALELGSFLSMGRGEELSGGRDKPSIVSDAMEALIGAIYLDSGLGAAREFIHRYVLSDFNEKLSLDDPKTELQEIVQQQPGNALVYEIVDESGPGNSRAFTAAVKLNGEVLAQGCGPNKKDAEQQAARRAIIILKDK